MAGAAVFKDNVYSAEHLAYWYIVSIMLEDKIIYKKNKKTCLQHVFEYLPSLKKINPNRFTDFARAIKTAEVFQIKPEELKKSEYMTPFFAVSTQESADAAMAELLSAEAKPATVKKCSTKAKKGSLKKKKIKGLAAASVTKTLKINANYISQISTAIKTNKLPEKIKTIFCLAEVISKIITPDQQSFFKEIYDSAENKFKNGSKALHYTTDLDMDSIIDFWNHSIKTMIEIVPPNNKKNSRILDYLASKILLKIEADLLDYINKNFSDVNPVFLIKSTATRMLQVNLGLPLDTTYEYDLLLPEIKASLPKDPKFHLHVGKLPVFNDSHHEFAVDYWQRTLLEYEGLFKNLQKICANNRDFRLEEVKHDQLAENFYAVATTKYSIGKNFTKFMSDQANLKLITKAAVVYLRKYVFSIKDKPFKYFQENLQKLLFEIDPEMIQQLNMVFHAFSKKNWLDRGINAFPGFYLFLLQHLQVKNTSNTEYLQSLGFLASERSNANFLQSQMIKQDPATTSLPNAIKRNLGKILQL